MSQELQTVSTASDLPFRIHSFIHQTGADEEFNRLALELFAVQFNTVPIYRQFCERRKILPGSIQRWEEIPALPVSAFKEHIVSGLGEKERIRVFHSSGTTTQRPGKHFHGAKSLLVYEASLLRWYERHFPGDDLVFIFLTPPPELAPHSSLIHMFETIRQELDPLKAIYAGRLQPDGSWALDYAEIDLTLAGAEAGKCPVAMMGTAFSFVHWLDHLAESKRRLQLPKGSRIMETGGYKGRSRAVAKTELRRLMTKFLGVPEAFIVTEYGMSELSSQAYDGVVGKARPSAGIFHFPPWTRTQIISPETGAAATPGETGLLRIFDLANIHSVMALQTEDLALARGDGFELLGRSESVEPRGCSLMAST